MHAVLVTNGVSHVAAAQDGILQTGISPFIEALRASRPALGGAWQQAAQVRLVIGSPACGSGGTTTPQGLSSRYVVLTKAPVTFRPVQMDAFVSIELHQDGRITSGLTGRR